MPALMFVSRGGIQAKRRCTVVEHVNFSNNGQLFCLSIPAQEVLCVATRRDMRLDGLLNPGGERITTGSLMKSAAYCYRYCADLL